MQPPTRTGAFDEMNASDAAIADDLAGRNGNGDGASPATGGQDVAVPAATDAPMRVLESRVYRGPNPSAYRPEAAHDRSGPWTFPTARVEGFTDRPAGPDPTLHKHGCSYGDARRFEPGLREDEGTWLRARRQHVAIELQCLAGTPVTYGKNRAAFRRGGGVYNVGVFVSARARRAAAGWLRSGRQRAAAARTYRESRAGRSCLPRDSTPASSPRRTSRWTNGASWSALIRVAQRLALGPTTQSIVDDAKRRGIPAIRLDEYSLVQLGYGKYQQRIRASVTSHSSHIAVETASDKALTNRLLADAGVPVPQSHTVRTAKEAVLAAEKFGYPVVTKPLDANHGRGVSLNLQNAEQVRWGFEQASEHGRSRSVLVEQFFRGRDYRVLVVDKRVVAVAERVPAHVVGDGEHTVAN
jgi:cyanophycin synthetase